MRVLCLIEFGKWRYLIQRCVFGYVSFLFTELCRFSGSFMIDDNVWRRFGVTGSCSNKGIFSMVLDESWDKDLSDCGETDLE